MATFMIWIPELNSWSEEFKMQISRHDSENNNKVSQINYMLGVCRSEQPE